MFVYNLIVAGSVEERMLGLQQRKKHLADAILGRQRAPRRALRGRRDDLFAPLAEGGITGGEDGDDGG